MIGLPRTISPGEPRGILRRVFERFRPASRSDCGTARSSSWVAARPSARSSFASPATFIRLVRDPSPLNFAEAYVECVIDIEGDLFAGMKVADALEEIRLSTVDRLRLLVSLWRE